MSELSTAPSSEDQDEAAQHIMKENSKAGPMLAINGGRASVKHSKLITYSAKPVPGAAAAWSSSLSCTIPTQPQSTGTRQGLFPTASLAASTLFWAARQVSGEGISHCPAVLRERF